MDATFLQDIRVSLQFDLLALKFKSHSDIPNSGDVQYLDSLTPDSEVIDLKSPNLSTPSLQIDRSHGGKMPPDDIDLRSQFRNGLLYYEELLYVPEGLCQLRVLQSRHDFPTAGHFGYNKTMELISQDFW